MASDSTKAYVVKIGGATFGDDDPGDADVVADIVALQRQGRRLVVVHGGGKLVTEWLDRQDAQRLLPDSTALMVVLHMRDGSVLTISEHGLETVAAVGMLTMAIAGLTSDDSEDDSGSE